MDDGFLRIPNWQSWENQGGGIAIADLSGGNGIVTRDLFVLRVDNPLGQNQGWYKVGKAFDGTGVATGGWGDWQLIPDWFSWENQGGGIAVFQRKGTARPDLYIFLVDDRPNQANRGVYRIGKTLDANGVVTGGWSDWQEVPDWFSWINDGASLSVADLDGSGQPDLILFMVDAPVNQPNRGVYRIGRNIDAHGIVTGGWTPWLDLPRWIFAGILGTGVAVTDTAGRKDVLFFHIEDAPTLNQGFYKIAHGLGTDGAVSGDWSPWYGAPGWFSWENQGGGIAVSPGTAADGRDLVFFGIDAPPQENAGVFRVFPFDEDPAQLGQWELLPYLSEVLPVHAATLPCTGEALFFAGSGNSRVRFDSPDFGDIARGVPCSVVWKPAGGSHFAEPTTVRDAQGRPIDLFCGGQCFLADGRLLASGGTKAYDVDEQDQSVGHGFFGRRDALAFDFQTGQWTTLTPMAGGRWYPTLICLGSGQGLVASGLDENGRMNGSLEIYDPAPNGGQGAWRTLHYPNVITDAMPLYAHLILLQDGRVFFTGGRMDDDQRQAGPLVLDLTTEPIGVTPVNGLADADSRNQSASVLLPPAQAQQVLIMGGATAQGEDNATGSVDKVDLHDVPGNTGYEPMAPFLLPRVHLNATLLPDRTVFVSGGALQREGGARGEDRKVTARFQSEIYDPVKGTWQLGATAAIERMYHSVALLLPDGRVFSASGNPDKGHSVQYTPTEPNEELHLEIYSPPYLFRGARPTIASTPDTSKHGAVIKINTPQALDIDTVSLIRAGSTTHSFNSDQRLVDLPILSRTALMLTVTVPNEANIVPPGYYMLFIVDKKNVPSVARWLHIAI